MIRLYAFPPSTKDLHGMTNTMQYRFDYDQAEHRILSQSVLKHDLFVNTIDKDFSGRLITLPNQHLIDFKSEVILITNSKLPLIIDVIDSIQNASRSVEPVFPDFILPIIYFLKLARSKKYDLISTSELFWNTGD